MTPPAALAELLGREMEDDGVSISQSGGTSPCAAPATKSDSAEGH
jgi:hypothetical protein